MSRSRRSTSASSTSPATRRRTRASYFFGQRKLPVEIRDLYGMLIDGMQGVAGALQTGGDEGGNLEGNLPTQAPLALFSGRRQGRRPTARRRSRFDLPGLQRRGAAHGRRLDEDKVGAAQADVIVRDPVVVTATLPRFLDVGDRSQMHVDIDNVDGEAGDYTLELDLHGPLTADADALRQTLHLAAHQRRAATIPIAAAGVGTADFDLRLTGPATVRRNISRSASSPARPTSTAAPSTPLCRAAASATMSGDLLADFIPGTGSIAVAASPFGALDAPALLQALDRYPYGCSEQMVSRAMPLLYANKLASLENLGLDPDLDGRV